MDYATFHTVGASGELTGLLIIKKYLEENDLGHKDEIVVPIQHMELIQHLQEWLVLKL